MIILLLLPDVAAVFRTGSMTGTEKQEETTELERCVAEVLPTEMPVTYELEALKAQAVIVRTNLLCAAMEHYGTESREEAAGQIRETDLEILGFSYYTPIQEEKLWGYENWERYREKCEKAAEATDSQVMIAGEKLLELPYHAVSAGKTRDGSVLGAAYQWLESADCPEDVEAPEYLHIREWEPGELPADTEILERDRAGYVTGVAVDGTSLGGEEFRARYGLESSCFSLERTDEKVRIVTKGCGHGLGLSMYQANRFANEGWKYSEILSYFYKNAVCISFSESGYARDSKSNTAAEAVGV